MKFPTEYLGYVIEFSIGLAGFSGVIAVFAGRSHDRLGLDVFRLRNLLLGASIPAFLSFLTLGFHSVLSDVELAWKLSLSLSIVCLGAYITHAHLSRASMPKTQQKQLQPWAFYIATGLIVVPVILQILTLVGVIEIEPFDALYFGLVSILLVATYQFIRAVLDGVVQSSDNT